ncbi:hypothetical protein TNIN_333831 [Trichonephila inaurata madagascariensis]|uniref:Uncharacterized protein n=1 Tax=Trichonephila inaurata madagascariensis TaxID=2747483 RepID=A0A8X7CP95_9ARAC|nr:hypothetical protein TNIN_333831 [Trichonephila inaurata madagascariensis]
MLRRLGERGGSADISKGVFPSHDWRAASAGGGGGREGVRSVRNLSTPHATNSATWVTSSSHAAKPKARRRGRKRCQIAHAPLINLLLKLVLRLSSHNATA